MKTVIWEVQAKSAPTAVRYCKRCGVRTEFGSSGLFRVNAQQKKLDVWLIYRCIECDTTWNMTVLSRVAPQSIPQKLLQGFHDNDPCLAVSYASDATLLKRNGAVPAQLEIEVVGMDVQLDSQVRIHIISEQPLGIKAEAAIRKKTGLFRNEYEKLVSSGNLICVSGHDISKCKLSGEIVIELNQA